MYTSINYAILAERVHTLKSEADTARRARQARRSRRGPAPTAAGAGRWHLGSTVRGITLRAGAAL
jgi:hypothetical protein